MGSRGVLLSPEVGDKVQRWLPGSGIECWGPGVGYRVPGWVTGSRGRLWGPELGVPRVPGTVPMLSPIPRWLMGSRVGVPRVPGAIPFSAPSPQSTGLGPAPPAEGGGAAAGPHQ